VDWAVSGEECEWMRCGVEADSPGPAIAITTVLAASAECSARFKEVSEENDGMESVVCESVEVVGWSLLCGREIDTQCW
jgi:hypothetical protein